MSSGAFSEGVLKFIGAINENIADMYESANDVGKAAAMAAEDIRLGCCAIALEAPDRDYQPGGIVIDKMLFVSPEGYEENGVIKEFPTREGGRLTVTLLPAKGEKWDEEETKHIETLAKFCFIISGRTRLISIVEKIIDIDRQTGVPNTDCFMKYGNILAAQGRLSDYAAAYINIKNFKYVNKTFGSRQGDILLKNFSQAMAAFVKDDGMFARLGGDNFILFIRKGRITDLRTFTDALSFEMGEGEEKQIYDLRLRMGIYEAGADDAMSDVMNKTTVAYNAAKMDLRQDVVFFSPVLLDAAIHKRTVSTLFPKALENREFVVYYQPKIRLSDNSLCGCEALSRWIRDGSVVPPMEYIPVLEGEGTICRLDFYIFELVCMDIKRWLEMGIEPVRVSVNFSKIHLYNNRLAEQIMGIVKKYGIDTKYIEVELTEMTGAEDFCALNSFVEKMKQNGISTSIDDFGTGYSSLNLLKDLDVDIIKLDKSFFSNIHSEDGGISTDRIVVKNIVSMVNELNMNAISEGVETTAQAVFLRDVKCSMAQGFLFDKPLPRDEYESRLYNRDYYKDKG